jgi:hypothetical protein
MVMVDASLEGRTDLPDNQPNAAPADWMIAADYCIPLDINSATYQLAAIWQMADLVQGIVAGAVRRYWALY